MPPTPPGRGRARTVALTLYAHPFELAVAVLLGASALELGIDPQTLAGILPESLVSGWVIANSLGILGIVVGLFGSADLTGNNPRRTAAMRAVEKAGLYLVAGATAAIAVALAAGPLTARDTVHPVTQLAAIAAACLLRAGAIRKAERIELDTLRAINAGDLPHPYTDEAGDE